MEGKYYTGCIRQMDNIESLIIVKAGKTGIGIIYTYRQIIAIIIVSIISNLVFITNN